MASPNISEIVTTTIRNRSKKIADNVSDNNALLYKLREKGKIKTFSGGQTILQELSYQENQTYKRYSGYEPLNIQPSDVFSAAEYNIRQAAVAVTISGLEELQNAGKERMIDLLEARITNAERTLANNISSDLYSDGTASGQIDGLQAQVADTPTSGTVGGINRATWTFWRSYSYDATSDGGTAASSSNIQTYMNRVLLQVTRGTDRPTLIIADNNYYEFFWASLQSIQRISSADMGSAGFRSLEYAGIPVIADGAHGGGCPANHMYFLNCDYLHFRPHASRNFVPIGADRFSTNQDAMVKLIGFAGNLTMSCAFLQGVLKD